MIQTSADLRNLLLDIRMAAISQNQQKVKVLLDRIQREINETESYILGGAWEFDVLLDRLEQGEPVVQKIKALRKFMRDNETEFLSRLRKAGVQIWKDLQSEHDLKRPNDMAARA